MQAFRGAHPSSPGAPGFCGLGLTGRLGSGRMEDASGGFRSRRGLFGAREGSLKTGQSESFACVLMGPAVHLMRVRWGALVPSIWTLLWRV